MVNRLLHQPTAHLRIQANEGNGYGYAHAVCELFGLSDVEMFECQCDETHSPADHNGEAAHPCNLHCILPYAAEQQE